MISLSLYDAHGNLVFIKISFAAGIITSSPAAICYAMLIFMPWPCFLTMLRRPIICGTSPKICVLLSRQIRRFSRLFSTSSSLCVGMKRHLLLCELLNFMHQHRPANLPEKTSFPIGWRWRLSIDAAQSWQFRVLSHCLSLYINVLTSQHDHLFLNFTPAIMIYASCPLSRAYYTTFRTICENYLNEAGQAVR